MLRQQYVYSPPKTLPGFTNTRRQSDTALQCAQQDIIKMKKAVLNLEETGNTLLSKIPGDLTKTVDSLMAQTDTLSTRVKDYDPKLIERTFEKLEDMYSYTQKLVDKDCTESEAPEQSTTFINDFSRDIANRLIQETQNLETNISMFIDNQLKTLQKKEKPKLKLQAPVFATTKPIPPKVLKLPRPENGPINNELIKQTNQLDELTKSVTDKSNKYKPSKIKYDSNSVLQQLQEDKTKLSFVKNFLEMYSIESKSAPKEEIQQPEVVAEGKQFVDYRKFEEFKQSAENYIEDMKLNLEDNKQRLTARAEELKMQLMEQQAKLTEFDDVVQALEDKITYLQFKADNILSNTVKNTESAYVVVKGINFYSEELESNANAILSHIEDQSHRLELDLPL
ncbi:hypothetical protein TVAG_340310 [Trichomonas vaginalis G3]|uniref:Uncharacterized protein n=1 Tax=Trichomonas vaginalis (strain ATCC PRA-98 / G3) TaxID=412133 RepID=A2EKE5_TRIV3|nr:hypothetical protein TVAGG3_0979890 [Trichomonas vaginalis G3]EAY06853.1 hypothetical protein TVAG_340310 [Trichomonas vaginalis G3]KAI5489207.1 hypothetical protein TVAGG3_0979890 [Trichomonas vaginalis G3]|eukprot:XP_001319076.1 hypothetical protein [Trichomonas vaginalis G3]